MDVVLDFVGDGAAVSEALAMLAPRGTYVAIGYGGKVEFPTADLVVGELTITGSLIGTHVELAELVALHDRSMVRVTTREYPLEAILDAMHDLREGRITGRAIMIP